jgi:uncharacterized membrane protein
MNLASNKDVRRLCAPILVFEAIVIALAIPVAVKVSGADPAVAGWVAGGLAVACLVLCALLRFQWAFYAGSLVQVAAIVTGVLVPMMYVLGAVFTLLWLWAIIMPLRHASREQANSANHTS